MAIKVDIRADIAQVRALYGSIGKGVERAAARALNDTVRTLRADGARIIKRKHPALKISDIKRAMVVTKATPRQLFASVDVAGKPLSLLRFRPHQLKRAGVKVSLGTRRVTLTYKGRKTFRVPAMHNDVFARRYATGRQIRRLRGPSLPGVFRAREREFTALARALFPKRLESRIQYELRKAEIDALRASRQALGRLSDSLRAPKIGEGEIEALIERQFRLPAGAASR